MGSWGVSLNGIYLSGGKDPELNLSPVCPDQVNVGCLTSPPEGLGLPNRRTEDVTFVQRDGVKHYSDWYEPRIITLQKVMVCDDSCGGFDSSCSARQKVRDLLQAWSRTCCDTELVVYSPCNSIVYESIPTPELVQQRINYFAYNSRGQAYTLNCGTFEFTNVRGFGSANGTYSTFTEGINLPAFIPAPTQIARKTWDTVSTNYCRDYPKCYDDPDATCYDNEIPGTSEGAGFIMGCTGTQAQAVTPGDIYTLSGYMRASINGAYFVLRVFFYDLNGDTVAYDFGATEVSIADEWSRVSHTVTVPTGAVTMQFALDIDGTGAVFTAGDTLDATAVLVELSDTLEDYFDGAYADTSDPVIGGTRLDYSFDGEDFESISRRTQYVYVPGRDRALNGPFGVIGRPRVAEVTWRGQGSSCAEVLLRFDAVDHRMYVLDECGTPGVSECVEIEPGSVQRCRSYPKCYETAPDNSYCYDGTAAGSVSVLPTRIDVLGTEVTYPVITFNPSLTNPRIQDVTTGKTVSFQGTIADGQQPVVVYTEDGTAYQNGVSVTHLINGSLDFSLDPGIHELRVLVQSFDDNGTVDVCWRPSVISA